jgi:hypothetical protein
VSNGDAVDISKIASSNLDSCDHTDLHPGAVDMEEKIGRANSAKPRTLTMESETVDTEWNHECIAKSHKMITDSLPGDPTISKDHSECHRLKRGCKLAETGVLKTETLGGNEKQASQEQDIYSRRPLVGAGRSGDPFPEVSRHHDNGGTKPPELKPSGLARTKGSQGRCPGKDGKNDLPRGTFQTPGCEKSILHQISDSKIDQLKELLEQHETKTWEINTGNISTICKKIGSKSSRVSNRRKRKRKMTETETDLHNAACLIGTCVEHICSIDTNKHCKIRCQITNQLEKQQQ